MLTKLSMCLFAFFALEIKSLKPKCKHLHVIMNEYADKGKCCLCVLNSALLTAKVTS